MRFIAFALTLIIVGVHIFAADVTKLQKIVFKKVTEPNEGAFTVYVPKDWKTSGGIFRIDPNKVGGTGNAIAALLEYKIMNNENGNVMMMWVPEYNYYDSRNSPVGQMGLFNEGSNYNGMLVANKRKAKEFVKSMLIPYYHKNISNLKIEKEQPFPGIVTLIKKGDVALGLNSNYDSTITTISYLENGINFEEKILAVVQDYGELGAGMWKNRSTIFVRYPKGEEKKWQPIFETINSSVRLNSKWIEGEIRGQIERGQIVVNTQQEINKIDMEIQKAHERTNSEINRGMYNTITGQEDYVNPYTKEVEKGSSDWKNRWINNQGTIVYSDDNNYDPNIDKELNITGFKRSVPKK